MCSVNSIILNLMFILSRCDFSLGRASSFLLWEVGIAGNNLFIAAMK
jgi:hypothetical protein